MNERISAGETGPVNVSGWGCELDDIVSDDHHYHAHEHIWTRKNSTHVYKEKGSSEHILAG